MSFELITHYDLIGNKKWRIDSKFYDQKTNEKNLQFEENYALVCRNETIHWGGVYIELRYGLNCTQKQLKCLNNFNGNEAHLVFICKWL